MGAKMMKMGAMKMASKMMKRKKTVKKTGKKFSVFSGRKEKTVGGLRKADLKKNKNGKVVSKKQSEKGKKSFKWIQKWCFAVKSARKALGIKGMVPVNGKSA